MQCLQNRVVIVACGVGRDSTAMLVGLHERRIRPEAILFADVGSEKQGTYDFIPHLQAWLARVNFPPLTIVRYEPVRAPNQRRGEKCNKPSPNRQGLELCCPPEHWETIAAVVREADSMKRLVLRNYRFTKRWIDSQWTNGVFGWSARQRDCLPHDLIICG